MQSSTMLIHEAAYLGNLEGLKKILSTQPYLINEMNDEFQTPLMLATQEGNLEVIQFLVENGANILLEHPSRHTALDMAVKSEQYEIAKYLAGKLAEKQPPELHKINPRTGWVLLSQAIKENDDHSIKLLSKNGFYFPTFSYKSRSDVDDAAVQRFHKEIKDRVKALGITHPLVRYNGRKIEFGYGPTEQQLLFNDIYQKFFKQLNEIYHLSDYTEYAKWGDEQTSLFERLDKIDKATLPRKILAPRSINNDRELIDACLENNRGLCVGEIHQYTSPKQFLIDNMPYFREQGVTTLYFEHLLDVQQDMLDEYVMGSPIDAPMPERLAIYLDWLDQQQKVKGKEGSFTNLAKAAKKNGIRIVAIDTTATYSLAAMKSSDINADVGGKRIKTMNMLMSDRFKQYDDGNKYLVFVGNGHAASFDRKEISQCGSTHVIGVPELLGCPSIYVADTDMENQQQKILPSYIFKRKVINTGSHTVIMPEEQYKYNYCYFRHPDYSIAETSTATITTRPVRMTTATFPVITLSTFEKDLRSMIDCLNEIKNYLDKRQVDVFEDRVNSWNTILKAIRTVAADGKVENKTLKQFIEEEAEKYKSSSYTTFSKKINYTSLLMELAKTLGNKKLEEIQKICGTLNTYAYYLENLSMKTELSAHQQLNTSKRFK